MSNFLDDSGRLNLQEMVKAYDADDNTSKIRDLRHSSLIKNDVERLLNLQNKYARIRKHDYKHFERIVISHCNFLWNNYTNIFNRLMKDELDINNKSNIYCCFSYKNLPDYVKDSSDRTGRKQITSNVNKNNEVK